MRSFPKFFFCFSTLILLDLGAAAFVFYSLPDPKELAQGTKLERYHQERKQSFEYHVGPGSSQYLRLNQIPQSLQQAVLFLEDASFMQHRGFDWYEMSRALRATLLEGKRLRGASTISQQLIKNLYLTPERTWKRKALEALLTIKLELLLTKPQILEIYLNSIDWGRGHYGLKSAARYYFGKTPQDLTVRESVFLASIIPNPARFSRLQADGLPHRFVRKQMMRSLEALLKRKVLSLEDYQAIAEDPYLNLIRSH